MDAAKVADLGGCDTVLSCLGRKRLGKKEPKGRGRRLRWREASPNNAYEKVPELARLKWVMHGLIVDCHRGCRE